MYVELCKICGKEYMCQEYSLMKVFQKISIHYYFSCLLAILWFIFIWPFCLINTIILIFLLRNKDKIFYE